MNPKPRYKRYAYLTKADALWSDNAADQLKALVVQYRERYKYVCFGLTSTPQPTFVEHQRYDSVAWSRMVVLFKTADPKQAHIAYHALLHEEGWVGDEDFNTPTNLFQEYKTCYAYVLLGKRKRSMKKKILNVASVFSGIGAPEQAIERLKIPHKILFACDNGERMISLSQEEIEQLLKGKKTIEKEKIIVDLYNQKGENLMERSYKANYTVEDDNFFQDIRFLDGTQFRNMVDIIIGGSPCQAFSSNGKRGGFEDTRGTLFYEYARIINESQPKCFIFENVKGLINHDKGNTWKTIKNVFQELNYNIFINKDKDGCESPILNAVDYGIPQQRKRLYLVGIRNDLVLRHSFQFPKPIQLKTTTYDYLDQQVPAKYYLGEKGFMFVTTHPSRAQVGLPIMTCQKANQQFNWNGTFIFEPLSSKHNPEILSKAYVGKWNGERGVCRMFTPRECLRLMGFPDSFKIVVNDNMMWRQSGNSIVVNVLEAIIKEIIKTGIFEV